MANRTLLFLLFAILSGCSSLHQRPDTDSTEVGSQKEENVDVDGLQVSLGMDRSPEELGYEEKSFNTCDVGYGYSTTHKCRTHYLGVLHFQMQCRETDGTISTTDYRVTPVVSDNVRWTLSSIGGSTKTDSNGFGQIVAISNHSMRKKKVRLTVDGKFMILTAEDLSRVVGPKSWCPR